jgi:hypothetical protein
MAAVIVGADGFAPPRRALRVGEPFAERGGASSRGRAGASTSTLVGGDLASRVCRPPTMPGTEH